MTSWPSVRRRWKRSRIVRRSYDYTEDPAPVGGIEPNLDAKDTSLPEHRLKVASWLILLLAGVIVASVAMLAASKWIGVAGDDINEFFAPVFTALVALVGAATSHYYGGRGRDGS